MITISLDEYGEFEKEDTKPLFIAGIIFDDQDDEKEEWTERNRIKSYYKRVIADLGGNFQYPEDLHSNGDKKRDREVIKLVKSKVQETLPEFITKGTYQGETLNDDYERKIRERKGKYHIFVILKSDDGKKSLLAKYANMLARDDYAANRYIHMAGSVVNRILFHNPIYGKNMPAINIDIATRSSADIGQMDEITRREFVKQAYRQNEAENSSYKYYSIMNADIYRTLIAQEMVNTGNTNVKIEKLYVRSIQYHAEKRTMEMLYLADSLCSMLAYQLEGISADEWLQQIAKKVENLNPEEENLIFGYDEIDNDFAKAWEKYEEKSIYEALSIIYDAKNKKGKFAEYYRKRWFPYLEKQIRESITPEYFTKSVNDLSDMLLINNLDQEKLVYLMQQFEEMLPVVVQKYKSPDVVAMVLYKLYDAGVSAFCHIGDIKKAMEYYEKCKEYAFYVGVDVFLRTNNKLAVCLEGAFEWDKAIQIAKDSVTNQELVSEIKRSILGGDDKKNFLAEAKSISQLARILAEKHNPKAEEQFRRALSKLERGSANYKITQSYLLHFYADMGMKEKYETEVTDYFEGKRTYSQRLKYIIKLSEDTDSVYSNEYALYVLIRGLFRFSIDSIEEDLWKRLCKLDELLEKKNGKRPSGHPWEMIYKYLEMIAISRSDEASREKFQILKENCLKYRGDIIVAIEKFGEAEIAEFAKEIDKRDQKTQELVSFLQERFEIMKNIGFSDEGEKRYTELEQYFTFMYR